MITFVTPKEPPWLQCHGSTVVRAGEDLLVSFFAGTREGTPDNQIWLARGSGGRWSPPEPVSAGPAPRWNPVLAWSPGGVLWLFSKIGSPISPWRTVARRSLDGGRTWDEELPVTPDEPGGRGPVRTPPVITADGTWVAGASTESADGRWDPFVDLSFDDGASWQRRSIPLDHDACPGGGAIQPALWTEGANVVALLRTTAGHVWRSSSADGGLTWSPAEPTSLPNNNSGIAACRLADGRVVCIHNASGTSWGPRNELCWSASADDGLTWRRGGTIDRLPPAASGIVGADAGVVTDGRSELSYPTVVSDGADLLVSYTWQRRRIALARLHLSTLKVQS